MTGTGAVVGDVPELGPSFGELALPSGVPRTRGTRVSVPLDDLRLALVTELFDMAGAAREFAAGGDRSSAVHSDPWRGRCPLAPGSLPASQVFKTFYCTHIFRVFLKKSISCVAVLMC